MMYEKGGARLCTSTFHDDYKPAPLGFCRNEPVASLPPASVIHKNTSYRTPLPLTRSTYKRFNASSVGVECRHRNEFCTNFHTGGDDREKTYQTSQKLYAPPLVVKLSADELMLNGAKSTDPLGVKVHADTSSEYSKSYIQMQPKICTPAQKSCYYTAAGSQLPRCDSKWATTQQTDFSVKSFEKEQQGPASLVLSANKPRRYTVVLPDPQGTASFETSHAHDFKGEIGCRATPAAAVNTSSIRLGDYSSYEFSKVNKPIIIQGRVKPIIRFQRNASFLSKGDLKPERVMQRIKCGTTMTDLQKPPNWSYTKHCDFSQLHTQSNIHFGNSNGTELSTTANSYLPINATRKIAKQPVRDNIPYYYPGFLGATINTETYCPHIARKPAQHYQNLQQSNWNYPSRASSYSTENKDNFTTNHWTTTCCL